MITKPTVRRLVPARGSAEAVLADGRAAMTQGADGPSGAGPVEPAWAVVTAAQMAEVDRIMVSERGVMLVQMMENAGRALATVARSHLGGDVAGKHVVVLAGTGGDGGGAMAAARRLHGWGAHPTVVTTRPDQAYDGVPAH